MSLAILVPVASRLLYASEPIELVAAGDWLGGLDVIPGAGPLSVAGGFCGVIVGIAIGFPFGEWIWSTRVGIRFACLSATAQLGSVAPVVLPKIFNLIDEFHLPREFTLNRFARGQVATLAARQLHLNGMFAVRIAHPAMLWNKRRGGRQIVDL
jgi:hypothetical protein